jgi:hypothetical protein
VPQIRGSEAAPVVNCESGRSRLAEAAVDTIPRRQWTDSSLESGTADLEDLCTLGIIRTAVPLLRQPRPCWAAVARRSRGPKQWHANTRANGSGPKAPGPEIAVHKYQANLQRPGGLEDLELPQNPLPTRNGGLTESLIYSDKPNPP